jgi:hypothetical protein
VHLLVTPPGDLLTLEGFQPNLISCHQFIYQQLDAHTHPFLVNVAASTHLCIIANDIGTVSATSFSCETIDFELETTRIHDGNLNMAVPFEC